MMRTGLVVAAVLFCGVPAPAHAESVSAWLDVRWKQAFKQGASNAEINRVGLSYRYFLSTTMTACSIARSAADQSALARSTLAYERKLGVNRATDADYAFLQARVAAGKAAYCGEAIPWANKLWDAMADNMEYIRD